MIVIGIKKGVHMTKRFMKEYGNDILRRKKEMFYSKDELARMKIRINKIIELYNKGYLTVTETMRVLVDIDNDY